MGDEIIAAGMVSGNVGRLHETIKEFNKQSQKHTTQMLWLTWVIAGLTLVMAVLVGVQIALMLE